MNSSHLLDRDCLTRPILFFLFCVGVFAMVFDSDYCYDDKVLRVVCIGLEDGAFIELSVSFTNN